MSPLKPQDFVEGRTGPAWPGRLYGGVISTRSEREVASSFGFGGVRVSFPIHSVKKPPPLGVLQVRRPIPVTNNPRSQVNSAPIVSTNQVS